jgi:succinate dehydrogenase / fumarate reductase membrane anchor subunit
MVKRVLTGAHYGLFDWLAQRVTALVMIVFVLYAVALLFSAPHDHGGWKALFGHSGMRIGTFLFLVSLFWHAWVGVRNILMDYVHGTAIRLALQVLVILSLLFYAVWSAEILWAPGTSWQ